MRDGREMHEMGIINLENIEAGMILRSDIKAKNGMILLRAGNEITQRHLKILRMWGVTEADIEGEDREEILSKAAAQIDPLLLQEAEAKAHRLFRHGDREHPFMKELLRLVTLRFARNRS